MVTLKWGLANSDNWISAYLMGKLNPYDLVRLIHSFGVRNKAIDPVVSLCPKDRIGKKQFGCRTDSGYQ